MCFLLRAVFVRSILSGWMSAKRPSSSIDSFSRKSGFQNLEKIIKIREIIHPDPRTHELYRPYQEMFRALYLNNRELMHQDGKSFA